MPVSQMHHPDLDKLTAFGLGLLSEADSAEIELHLSDCAACCEKLEYLPADSLVDLLQASEADTPSDLSHAFQTVDSGLPASAPASLPPLYKKLANIVGGKPAVQTVKPSAAKVAAFHAHKIPAELAGHSRYEVLELLGAGGMGAVYKAKHRLMDRMVALKIVNPLLVTKPGAVERFIREVKAAAQLTHPNIVTAYDAEQIGEMHVLVMEYVEGDTLAELLQEQGVLGVTQACDYVRQTALGLQHAVDCGMVHRDVKPLNLMLTRQQVVKILDFGLARFVSEQRPLEGSTEQGSMMGSPDYMAPEQARDAHTADARADIYSLGCTLYQLLAGQVPFPGMALLEKLEAHRDQQPPALYQIRFDVPAELERIIAKMMAKDPAQRFQTPAEVAEALLPFTKAQPISHPVVAKPKSSFAPRKHALSQSERRRFAAAILSAFPKSKFPAAIAVVAALLLAAIGYWAAQVVLRVETPQGTLIVETDDPDVQISVKSGGKEVALFFPQQKKEVPLKVGEYTVELVNGKDGLKLSTNKFEIKSGSDEKTVTVEFVPTVAEQKTPKIEDKSKPKADPTLPAISSVSDLLAKAQAAIDQKQFEQAIGHCNEVLRQDPNNIEAVYLRASPQWNLGKADLAIQDVTAVLKLNPDHDNARHDRAFYYLNTGKPDECIADVNILLSRDKTSGAAAGAFANRGAAWAGKGRFEKGLADFEAAIKITPTYAMAHHWHGMILQRLGEHAKAKTAFASAVKIDKGFATRRTNQLDHVIPQPMPLAEWREGREFLTVAQTGPADHRTIREALYACKAGQYVKVLDKGPYRETIFYNRPIADNVTDIALVSDVGTRIEVPRWREWGASRSDKGKKTYQGCLLIGPTGLRLSGFEFRLPPLPPDTDSVVAVDIGVAGDFIFESCQVRYHRDVVAGLPVEEKEQFGRFVGISCGWDGEWGINKGRFLVQDNLIDGKVRLRADGPVQVTVQRNWIRAGHPQPSLELPYHAETESAVRHNVIQGYNGIALRARGPEKTAATAGRYLIANNLIEVEVAPFWALGPVKEQEDRQALSRWVTIQNNVLRSKGRYGLQLHADDLKAMTGVWKIGHNCFRTEPIQTTTNGGLPVIAKQPTDLIVAGPFLSDDPQHADYLRIVADGRLAASGIGGNLPSYIGPLPPGPAPKEGDWFTRLLEGRVEKE